MKKNTASQVIGAQMVAAADGSAFTGAVVAYVTGDGGTQGAGSVGSGACTHEGNGFHTYAPAQAETNFDHVAFTFVGTGAVPATVQVYTTFPQAGDAFARLGVPAGASVSADVLAVKTETASIQADTNDLQTRVPAALVSGRMDSSVGAMAANVMTAAAAAADLTTELQAGLATSAALTSVASDVTATKVVTDKLGTAVEADGGVYRFTANALEQAPTGGSAPTATAIADEVQTRTIAAVTVVNGLAANTLTAAALAADAVTEIQSGLATASALSTVAGYVDTEVAAIKAKTDLIPASPAATGDIPSAAAIADAVWDEAVDGTTTARQSVRLTNSALAGKASGMATTEVTFRDLADTKDRLVATVTSDGDRSAVTRDLT